MAIGTRRHDDLDGLVYDSERGVEYTTCSRLALRDRHAADGVFPGDAAESPAAVWQAVGATAAGVSGYLAAHLVVALITGIPPVVPGRIETVNLAALQAPLALDDRPHPDCPACGAGG